MVNYHLPLQVHHATSLFDGGGGGAESARDAWHRAGELKALARQRHAVPHATVMMKAYSNVGSAVVCPQNRLAPGQPGGPAWGRKGYARPNKTIAGAGYK